MELITSTIKAVAQIYWLLVYYMQHQRLQYTVNMQNKTNRCDHFALTGKNNDQHQMSTRVQLESVTVSYVSWNSFFFFSYYCWTSMIYLYFPLQRAVPAFLWCTALWEDSIHQQLAQRPTAFNMYKFDVSFPSASSLYCTESVCIMDLEPTVRSWQPRWQLCHVSGSGYCYCKWWWPQLITLRACWTSHVTN